jgi:uncharacterized protein (DUF1499 family)
MGLLAGKRPDGLGFASNQFKPCSWKPNCVNSTADPQADAKHHIDPLRFKGDAAQAWKALAAMVKARPRTKVVKEEGQYLYCEFSSKGLGYVDDVEFALDPAAGVIHVRSASRLGIRDFGVNRARIESIRKQFLG